MEANKIMLKMTLWIITGFGVALFGTGRIILGKDLPKEVPLWYSKPWGESQLASPNSLIIIPVLMIVITIVTQVLSQKIERGDVKALIVSWSGIIANAILTLAMLRIWILAL